MGESGGREGDDVWPEMMRVWTVPVAVAMAADSTEIHRDTQTSRANVRLDSGSCHPSSPVFLSAGPFLALDRSAGITPSPGATSVPAGL